MPAYIQFWKNNDTEMHFQKYARKWWIKGQKYITPRDFAEHLASDTFQRIADFIW